jgi:hypothetical protein
MLYTTYINEAYLAIRQEAEGALLRADPCLLVSRSITFHTTDHRNPLTQVRCTSRHLALGPMLL